MSRTYRRTDFEPWWLDKKWRWCHLTNSPYWKPEEFEKMLREYHTDAMDGSSDACPPKWFRQSNQRKHRHKQNTKLKKFWQDDPIILHDYKMPYYT